MTQASVHIYGVVSTNAPASIDKFRRGLLAYLNERRYKNYLRPSFGELKAFNLVWENRNGSSKVQIRHV